MDMAPDQVVAIALSPLQFFEVKFCFDRGPQVTLAMDLLRRLMFKDMQQGKPPAQNLHQSKGDR
jgi:hypothetical protein